METHLFLTVSCLAKPCDFISSFQISVLPKIKAEQSHPFWLGNAGLIHRHYGEVRQEVLCLNLKHLTLKSQLWAVL